MTREQAIELARGKVHDVCLEPNRTSRDDGWSFHDMWIVLIVLDTGDYYFL